MENYGGGVSISQEGQPHTLSESTLDTLAFYMVKIRTHLWAEPREPCSAPKVNTLPTGPLASTAKYMHVTQTVEDSGPRSERELRENLCLNSQPSSTGEGQECPNKEVNWLRSLQRKFKVLCLLTAIYGNLKK